MAERYINKKLQQAIDQGLPFFWEYGTFKTYYTGFILRARTGINENGTIRSRVVFATQSLAGAKEVKEMLSDKGIHASDGWCQAGQRYNDHQVGWPPRNRRL